VLLYELLTGERLISEDVHDELAQVLTKSPNLEKAPRRVRRLLENLEISGQDISQYFRIGYARFLAAS